MAAFYLTMGKCDLLSIADFPSDEAAATVLLSLGSGGGIRTDTMRAFTEDQYRDIIAEIQAPDA